MDTSFPLSIQHNAGAGRFEAWVDGQLCQCAYHLVDGVMWLTHTEVPPALEGRGLAAALVAAALAHARAQGWTVRPACSYVRTYMRRHPETADLLATAP
jgi:uncharacterized protein